jgi:hypothetical protein
VLDLDRFEGKTDADILAHLKSVAMLATEGQLMSACDISPDGAVSYTRVELMNLYVSKTIETIRRLRG